MMTLLHAHAPGRVRGLKGHRWLVAACETKILMTDLATKASRELPRAALDGRAPTALAALYKCSPLLLGALTRVLSGSKPLSCNRKNP
jgi:hypothetical protein